MSDKSSLGDDSDTAVGSMMSVAASLPRQVHYIMSIIRDELDQGLVYINELYSACLLT